MLPDGHRNRNPLWEPRLADVVESPTSDPANPLCRRVHAVTGNAIAYTEGPPEYYDDGPLRWMKLDDWCIPDASWRVRYKSGT